MIDFDAKTIQQLAEGMSEGSRLHEGAGIAGTGLLLPLARLRTRAARRELARIRTREGERSDAARAQAALVAGLTAREQDAARLFAQRAAPMATPGPAEAAIAGRVTRDGQPLFDVEVLVLDAKLQPLRRTCTGRDGRYALALAADQDLLFELREAGKAIYRDKSAQAYPAGYRGQRDFEVGRAAPVCEPAPPPDPTQQTLHVPDLGGLTRDRAAKLLSALGLKPGMVSERVSARVGLVIEQHPKAGEVAQPGSAVDLVLGRKDDKPGLQLGALKDQPLKQALRLLREQGLTLHSVTVRTGSTRTPLVQAAREAGAAQGTHLDVTVAGGKAAESAEAELLAALLLASPEGQAMGLDSAAKASRWLTRAKIASLKDLAAAAGEDDAALRKRLGLDAGQDLAGPRQALRLAADRIHRA